MSADPALRHYAGALADRCWQLADSLRAASIELATTEAAQGRLPIVATSAMLEAIAAGMALSELAERGTSK